MGFSFPSVIGGGVLGAAVTYGLTWVRERRRTLDAYRAPQRQAIGDIITATHEYMLRELEQRTLLTDLAEQIRQDTHIVSADDSWAATKATAAATLGVERSFQIGSLTIVDAYGWEAMITACAAFERLKAVKAAAAGGAPDVQNADDVEQHIRVIAGHADQLNQSGGALVRAAYGRLSPVDGWCNRRRRRESRRRLGQ